MLSIVVQWQNKVHEAWKQNVLSQNSRSLRCMTMKAFYVLCKCAMVTRDDKQNISPSTIQRGLKSWQSEIFTVTTFFFFHGNTTHGLLLFHNVLKFTVKYLNVTCALLLESKVRARTFDLSCSSCAWRLDTSVDSSSFTLCNFSTSNKASALSFTVNKQT